MRYFDEPHRLVAGVPIHIGAISMLDDLRASGHTVELDADGDLVVAPRDDLHENQLVCLEAFTEDLVLLLSLSESTVH